MRPLAAVGRQCGLLADAGPAWCRQTWTLRGCRNDWTDGLPRAPERAAGGAGLRGDPQAVESTQEADVAAVVADKTGKHIRSAGSLGRPPFRYSRSAAIFLIRFGR